jgi:hypothetical protein
VTRLRFPAHADDPLPRFDVSPLLKYSPPGPSKDSQTIQVDVMAIAGSTAFPLGLTCTFYDTEILAIIHRSKSSSTGLISSTVWSWQGKSSSIGESEERKLTELAKRYGTSIVRILLCFADASINFDTGSNPPIVGACRASAMSRRHPFDSSSSYPY